MTRAFVVLTVLLLGGCDSGSHEIQHTPQPSLVSVGATITVDTNQHTVRMRGGQSQGIFLAADGYFTWDALKLSTPDVVKLSNVRGGYPAEGYSATVTAIHTGSAQLQTESDAFCQHSKPACRPAQQEYTVTVIVS